MTWRCSATALWRSVNAAAVTGLAVGIAGDEVRRYGLDTEKRSRLIKAGADIIIPDFSQTPIQLGHLLGN